MRIFYAIILNMRDTRIVFMGTPEFAAHCLEGLLEKGYNIVAVVTQTDKEVGRKKVLTYSKVKEVALKYGIKIFQPQKIRREYEDILALDPELILTCAYGQIIPKAILDYPRCGCINTHGSLLPKLRGGAPIQRAIIEGYKETGVTLMYMSEKMDEGDMLFKKSIKIEDDDTNTTLFKKLSDLALEMLLEHLDAIIDGDVKPLKQDPSEATYAYNLKKEDEFISFNQDAKRVYDHIRGLLDEPGAYGIIEGKSYKFHKVRYLAKEMGKPGEVLGLYDKALAIACKNGTILVDEIQAAGKKKMDAVAFYNGSGKSLVGKEFSDEQ